MRDMSDHSLLLEVTPVASGRVATMRRRDRDVVSPSNPQAGRDTALVLLGLIL
jgi:hypothetical protein